MRSNCLIFAIWRTIRRGGVSRPAIDWLFSMLGDKNHCFTSYISAKYNIPTKDY